MNIFPPDPARCPLCGEANHCQLCTPSAYKGPCWCASRDMPAALLARVPSESRNRACICQQCVDQFELELKLSPNSEPRPTRRSGFTRLPLLAALSLVAGLGIIVAAMWTQTH